MVGVHMHRRQSIGPGRNITQKSRQPELKRNFLNTIDLGKRLDSRGVQLKPTH